MDEDRRVICWSINILAVPYEKKTSIVSTGNFAVASGLPNLAWFQPSPTRPRGQEEPGARLVFLLWRKYGGGTRATRHFS